MLICMQTTSVRIDVDTHRELKKIASEMHVSVGEAVRHAVRHLHQGRIGVELRADLTHEETDWLDADLG